MSTSLSFLSSLHFYYREPAPEPLAQASGEIVPVLRPERDNARARGIGYELPAELRGRVARVRTLDGRTVAFERSQRGIGLTSGSRAGFVVCDDDSGRTIAFLECGAGIVGSAHLQVAGIDDSGRSAAFPKDIWTRDGRVVSQEGGQLRVAEDGTALLGRLSLERSFEPLPGSWIECDAAWLGFAEPSGAQTWTQRQALAANGGRELALRVDLRELPLGRVTTRIRLIARGDGGGTQCVEECDLTLLHRPVVPIDHVGRLLRSGLAAIPGIEPGRAYPLARLTNDRPDALSLRILYSSVQIGVRSEKSAKEITIPARATRDLVLVQPARDARSPRSQATRDPFSPRAAIRIRCGSGEHLQVPLAIGHGREAGSVSSARRGGYWVTAEGRNAMLFVQPFVGLADEYECIPRDGDSRPRHIAGNRVEFAARELPEDAEWIVREKRSGWTLAFRTSMDSEAFEPEPGEDTEDEQQADVEVTE